VQRGKCRVAVVRVQKDAVRERFDAFHNAFELPGDLAMVPCSEARLDNLTSGSGARSTPLARLAPRFGPCP